MGGADLSVPVKPGGRREGRGGCLVAAHLADPAAAERRDAETDH